MAVMHLSTKVCTTGYTDLFIAVVFGRRVWDSFRIDSLNTLAYYESFWRWPMDPLSGLDLRCLSPAPLWIRLDWAPICNNPVQIWRKYSATSPRSRFRKIKKERSWSLDRAAIARLPYSAIQHKVTYGGKLFHATAAATGNAGHQL